MPKHIALVIGISKYKFLPDLAYAQKDAELMQQFLAETAGFNTEKGGGICLCTQSSPHYQSYSTHPTRAELRRILRRCFDQTFLTAEDSFWFFFSGHGIRYDDKDYLMPADGDPEEPDETAIELNYVTERLTRSGAGQVVMILDACRSEGQKSSQGGFGQDVAKGVTTIFSCHPQEPSYEIGDPICQSAFTHVLLQSCQQQTPDNALTVLQLEQYLQREVPKLNQQHRKPPQRPHIRCDFATNGSKILLPHLRAPLTVEQLKAKAFRAEALDDWAQAKHCWLTVLRRAAVNSTDHQEAEAGLERVILKSQLVSRTAGSKQGTPPIPQSPDPVPAPPAPKPEPEDDLSSEKGVDYSRLRDLLKAGNWKAADVETAHRMLEAVGRKEDDWIRNEELLNFPCVDLLTIDRLWVRYSNKRFGFSVQKQIWQECGSPTSSGKDWDKFCVRVGWQDKTASRYLGYDDLKADPSISPLGEFPGALFLWCGLVGVFLLSHRDL